MTTGRRIFLFAALLASAACSSSTGPADPIVGVWSLQTWSGKTLPAIVYGSSSGYHEQIVAERFVFSNDGTYTMTRTYRYMPEARSEIQSGSGAWKKNSTGYVLGSGFVPGKMSGGTLSVQWKGDGVTEWAYIRGG